MATRSGRSIGGGYNNPPPIFYVDLIGVSDSDMRMPRGNPRTCLEFFGEGRAASSVLNTVKIEDSTQNPLAES